MRVVVIVVCLGVMFLVVGCNETRTGVTEVIQQDDGAKLSTSFIPVCDFSLRIGAWMFDKFISAGSGSTESGHAFRMTDAEYSEYCAE